MKPIDSGYERAKRAGRNVSASLPVAFIIHPLMHSRLRYTPTMVITHCMRSRRSVHRDITSLPSGALGTLSDPLCEYLGHSHAPCEFAERLARCDRCECQFACKFLSPRYLLSPSVRPFVRPDSRLSGNAGIFPTLSFFWRRDEKTRCELAIGVVASPIRCDCWSHLAFVSQLS